MNYILSNNKNTIDHHHNNMQSTSTTTAAFCHQRIEDEALESESDSSCHAIILFTSQTSAPISPPMISTSNGKNHHGTGKKSNNCVALDRKPAPQPQPQQQPQPQPPVCPSSSSSSLLTLAKTIPRLGGRHGGGDRRTTTTPEDRADNHNHPKHVNINNDNATGIVQMALEVVHHDHHHHDEDKSSSSAKEKKYDDDDDEEEEEDLLLIDDEPIESNSEYRKELLKDDMRMFGKALSRLLIYDDGVDSSDSSESESHICLEDDDYMLE